MSFESPGWQELREGWNREGRCARAACQGPIVPKPGRHMQVGRHTTTGLRYCQDCASMIANAQPPGAIVMEVVSADN